MVHAERLINLVGIFEILRLAAAAMRDLEAGRVASGERGVIINTASIAAFEGQIGQAAYAASKGGVVSLTLPAARELARYGIRVLTIAPGTFATPMLLGLPEETQQLRGEAVPFRRSRRLCRPRAAHDRQRHAERHRRPPRRRAAHAAKVGAAIRPLAAFAATKLVVLVLMQHAKIENLTLLL